MTVIMTEGSAVTDHTVNDIVYISDPSQEKSKSASSLKSVFVAHFLSL